MQTGNVTKWNSQVEMIRSVLVVPTPPITAYNRNIMKDMLEILEPFEQATDIKTALDS